MEKKNTMLLTVIAVATLLVAVVGATFAYFSLTVGGSATTTTVTGSTGEIATITYVQENTEATLEVTTGDMAQPTTDTKYFATTDDSKTDSTNGGKWLKESSTDNDNYKVINLGGVSLSGKVDETYTCTYTITVKPKTGEADADTMIAALKDHTGDVILNLSAPSGANFSESVDGGFDLSSLTTSKDFTATFDLTSSDNQKTFDANLYLVNKAATSSDNNGVQNYLANKKLSLEFTTKADCKIKSTGE